MKIIFLISYTRQETVSNKKQAIQKNKGTKNKKIFNWTQHKKKINTCELEIFKKPLLFDKTGVSVGKKKRHNGENLAVNENHLAEIHLIFFDYVVCTEILVIFNMSKTSIPEDESASRKFSIFVVTFMDGTKALR